MSQESGEENRPSAIPHDFDDPVGLAVRVFRSGGSHGRFSLLAAGLSLAATPLDVAFRGREAKLRAAASMPRRPVALVCGPARSGTTIMAQALLRATSAGYVTNLMDMFPRSPLVASRVFRVRPAPESVPLSSHYGRMAGFSSPNDALSLWDRWLGGDRTRPEGARAISQSADINGFFGALEKWTGRFVVTKNNSLNAVAADVGEAVPAAHFICMRRDDIYLAQSLLVARGYIHGDESHAYGLPAPGERDDDVIEDVATQVEYHRELASRQAALLGPERFRIVDYERLCAEPRVVIAELARSFDAEVDLTRIPESFSVSRRVTLDRQVFNQLRERLNG